jgi:NADH:ubiquinone oxidoreductase subunit E
MKVKNEPRLARVAAAIAALVVLTSTGLLIAGYLSMRHRAPLEKAKVEAMEEAVQTDARIAVDLTAERERQTERSLQRDSQNLVYAYILLAGAVMFLVAMNWLKSFEENPKLPLEALVTLRDENYGVLRKDVLSKRDLEVAPVPEVDLSFVDEFISKEGRGKDAAVPILRAIQLNYGYLPDEALQKVCEETEITPAQIAGTSTFYSQFRLSPVGKHLVKLCHGTACHVSGIGPITEELRRQLSIGPEEDTDPSRLFTIEKVACLGCCSLAPVMMIDEETAGRLTPASACQSLHNFEAKRAV